MAKKQLSADAQSNHSGNASKLDSDAKAPSGPPEMDEYPPKGRVLIIVAAMMASAFLVALVSHTKHTPRPNSRGLMALRRTV